MMVHVCSWLGRSLVFRFIGFQMGLDEHFKGTGKEKKHSYLDWKIVGFVAIGAAAFYATVR
jgi:hypothetical protein